MLSLSPLTPQLESFVLTVWREEPEGVKLLSQENVAGHAHREQDQCDLRTAKASNPMLVRVYSVFCIQGRDEKRGDMIRGDKFD